MENTMTPTPGVPLNAEGRKLLVKGDLLSDPKWGLLRFDYFDDSQRRAFLVGVSDGQVRLLVPHTFIGRPDAEGWMKAVHGTDLSGVSFEGDERPDGLYFRLVTPSDQGEKAGMGEILRRQAEDRSRYLNPTHATPAPGSDGLIERLRAQKVIPSGPVDGNLWMPRNPDGPEAADALEAAEKRIGEESARSDRAEERIRELADMFGVCDGGRYLNDWKARLEAHQSQVAALKAALDELQDVFAHDGESSMERFERLAEMFRKDTGYLAPGKDAPMDSHQPEGDELRRIYDEWFDAKVSRARSVLQALALKEGR